jgi:hypothetical protein
MKPQSQSRRKRLALMLPKRRKTPRNELRLTPIIKRKKISKIVT